MKYPIQPVIRDVHGVVRFQRNALVCYLLRLTMQADLCDLHQLAGMDFDDEDREQFAQLLGYSLSGAAALPYMSAEVLAEAAGRCSELLKQEKA